jgi:hypothetical protein
LPETERRESPAAREAAVIEKALMEVIVERGVSGWGVVSPDEHTISASAASRDELDLFQL